MEETKNKLDVIQKIVSGYSDGIVTKKARLEEDLGLDSFLVVYFLTEVEDVFEIEIDESEFQYIRTIQDVLERIAAGEKNNCTNNGKMY